MFGFERWDILDDWAFSRVFESWWNNNICIKFGRSEKIGIQSFLNIWNNKVSTN